VTRQTPNVREAFERRGELRAKRAVPQLKVELASDVVEAPIVEARFAHGVAAERTARVVKRAEVSG
jgi:hypothetical protein